MDYLTIGLIGVGLSMDGLAVSITAGTTFKQKNGRFYKSALLGALFFGVFQAIMPLLGNLAGLSAKEFVMGIDHWIAFFLLGYIGVRMLISGFRKDKESVNLLDISNLTMLAIATSIDAFVVGITFAFLSVQIWQAAVIIGAITFCICLSGAFLGNCFSGNAAGRNATLLGGLILIAIGFKILIEHLTAK